MAGEFTVTQESKDGDASDPVFKVRQGGGDAWAEVTTNGNVISAGAYIQRRGNDESEVVAACDITLRHGLRPNLTPRVACSLGQALIMAYNGASSIDSRPPAAAEQQ